MTASPHKSILLRESASATKPQTRLFPPLSGGVALRIRHRLDQQSWLADLQRRVQHYGYRYDYTARQVTADLYLGALPDWLQPQATRLHHEGLFASSPDQVIVNDYQPGQGIASHVDCIPCFGDTIASLSLGSGCLMDFTHSNTAQKTGLFLPSRSLLMLQGDARYHWQHGIAKRKSDVVDGVKVHRGRRVSLTFRNVTLHS
ncbi:MAG: alpha-ketoglutarate-dependent dioxygenase AlkB [Holosporales bacterium]